MKNNETSLTDTGLTKSYSIEAEQAVLGSVLIEPLCFSTVSMIVRPEYFYLPQHRAIYGAMLSIDAAGKSVIDPLLILEILRKEKVFSSDEDGKTYLFRLADIVPSTSNVETYCKLVKDKFYLRTLVNVSNEIIELAENSGEEADNILDSAEQKIYDIRQGKAVAGPSDRKSVV